jgi:hypothetical protein
MRVLSMFSTCVHTRNTSSGKTRNCSALLKTQGAGEILLYLDDEASDADNTMPGKGTSHCIMGPATWLKEPSATVSGRFQGMKRWS